MIDDYFGQTLELRAPTLDHHGDPTWGNPVSSASRFQLAQILFRDSAGEKRLSDAITYVPAAVTVALGYRVDYGGDSYKVERHSIHEDLDGPVFHKLVLQRLSV